MSSLEELQQSLLKRAPSLGDPQFGKTYEALVELVSLGGSIIEDAELEIRKSGTLDKIRDWKQKQKTLYSRLRQ